MDVISKGIQSFKKEVDQIYPPQSVNMRVKIENKLNDVESRKWG